MDYDYLVIGGGSGGIASAKMASQSGAKKVGIIESHLLGGTCVNVGCVPKKLMWEGSKLHHEMNLYGQAYGLSSKGSSQVDFLRLVENRNRYIEKLNGIYKNGLDANHVEVISGHAKFLDNHSVQVNGKTYTANHILVATGGHPFKPDIPSAEYGLDSDQVFELKNLPKRVAIIGGGYIGVEFSGLFHHLGSEVKQFIRGPVLLRGFDATIQEGLHSILKDEGHPVYTEKVIKGIEKNDDQSLELLFEDGSTYQTDCLIWATGRQPNSQDLGLENTDVQLTESGHIKVDKSLNTSAKGIYAIGDVVGKKELTPVAIAEGRTLAKYLFDKKANRLMDYDCIPSVVFAHPPIGTVGLTEREAIDRFGRDQIHTYSSQPISLKSAMTKHPQKAFLKLICLGEEEKIIGLHGIGEGLDESLQGFAVAIKMGANKDDFDQTVAIHPTMAEEFVTMT